MRTTNVATETASDTGTKPWPLERLLFLMAGTMTLVSAGLGAFLSPWFLLIAAFVAVNQLLFVATGDCVASLVLERRFGIERGDVR